MKEIQEEVSAGGVLMRKSKGIREALVIKVRYYGYELPKGHLEGDENFEQAAGRELCEETTLLIEPVVGKALGDIDYTFTHQDKRIHKIVHYYVFTTKEDPIFGKKPDEVKERRWIKKDEVSKLPLVNEKLRKIISKAFDE
ncbi:MAG: NUDIX domain-containing protein [Candidatus Sericytochromatia bacterium]|nr:NUDIX domain-containing protein [Candidatus Sericytochromatia bacterium]